MAGQNIVTNKSRDECFSTEKGETPGKRLQRFKVS